MSYSTYRTDDSGDLCEDAPILLLGVGVAFPSFREDEHVEIHADWLALLLLSV